MSLQNLLGISLEAIAPNLTQASHLENAIALRAHVHAWLQVNKPALLP